MSLVALGDSITLGMGDPMPDGGWRGGAALFGLPGALARPLSRRIRAVNAVADAVAARYGSVHFDAAGHPQTYDRRMWSVDRLHPSERGHRLVAHSYAALLGVPGPGLEPDGLPPTRRAKLGWLATKGTRWVVDRSTDLVPYLVAMAAAEWWYGLRGTGYRLDEAAARETAAALRALTGPARLGPQPEPLGLGHGPT
ncbi:MAG: hypothetical protein E6F99_26985 [Actinobacteria bacterium]|nr:MAG: hypothetical protein E6F99_26985 [Actinomycetota bacterium]